MHDFSQRSVWTFDITDFGVFLPVRTVLWCSASGANDLSFSASDLLSRSCTALSYLETLPPHVEAILNVWCRWWETPAWMHRRNQKRLCNLFSVCEVGSNVDLITAYINSVCALYVKEWNNVLSFLCSSEVLVIISVNNVKQLFCVNNAAKQSVCWLCFSI
jgi:hypothetical protein